MERRSGRGSALRSPGAPGDRPAPLVVATIGDPPSGRRPSKSGTGSPVCFSADGGADTITGTRGELLSGWSRINAMSPHSTTVLPTCPVRGCAAPLARELRVWCCPRGHSFDVARSGYVNLLQPGDRRSRSAGDSREAQGARSRLEGCGLAEALHAAIEEEVRSLALPEGAGALEIGAGSGRLLERLVAAFGLEGWALDLSADAVDRGARARPGLTWIVANADRRLPFESGAFALLLSVSAPKNPAEFRRVLAPGGTLLLALPAPDDLIELRAVLLGEGRALDRATRALEAFDGAFRCARRTEVRTRPRLSRADLDDVLLAAYRGARQSERARLAGVEELEVTLSTELLVLVPR